MPLVQKASSASLLKALPKTVAKAVSRRLLAVLCAGLALTAQAQWAAGTANNNASPNGSGATAGASAATAAPEQAANGLPRSLALPQDAVAGASDAARSPRADAAERDGTRLRPPPKPLAPSQFQRFVEEATGKLLPVYGREFFENPQAYTPDGGAPAPADYVLGPGDEIKLQVWGAVDFSGNLTLDRNGQVNLPKAGAVTLAGVPVRDVEGVLRKHLGQVFANFNLNANPGRLRSIQVYVVGQAQQPGSVQVSSLSTLVNALFASGGPTANGSMRAIQIKRGGKTVTTLDLYDFLARGDKGRDLPLLPGDVIVIPPVGPRVAVTGAFDQAAIYELKPGTNSVADILALGGGVPALASNRRALIERIAPERNPPRQVQDIVLNAEGLRQPLRDGDVLTLLPISPAFANAVTLQGTVAEPLRHPWREGMKILDLIPEREALITPDYYKRKNLLVQASRPLAGRGAQAAASGAGPMAEPLPQAGQSGPSAMGVQLAAASNQGDEFAATLLSGQLRSKSAAGVAERVRGMADTINWDYAVIERLDPERLSTQLIPFNLGKAVLQRDPAHNLPLQPGDVVTILSQNDLRLPVARQTRLVRVEGEVAAPGVYQAQPGETLPQLLQRIGGLTPQAYVFGTELNRESVRKRQQENLDALIRRLEAQLQSQAASVTANLRSDNAAQAQALLQQQQMQLKSQIDRLKSVNSNGRLALELNPDQATGLAALPALPLEDGDRVLVPAAPGFVAAFGSVNNENVFIHKPGKTVGEVIKSAGLTEDAEPSQAFVLRADGSIVARRDYSGLFSGFESLALMPGDTVVVPAQIDRESRYNFWTRVVKDWTQIFANLGLGVAAINSISN